MARCWLSVVAINGRRIQSTWTQGYVRTPGIVMCNPRFQNGPQMGFGEGFQPIQTLAPNGAEDSFADRIRFRAARRRFQHVDAKSAHRFVEMHGKDAVAIMQCVLISVLEPDSLAQWLQRPGGGWMRGDVAMNQATTTVLDDGEYIEQPERGGHDDHRIKGNDSLGVQTQERHHRRPPLGRPGGQRGRYFRTVRGET